MYLNKPSFAQAYAETLENIRLKLLGEPDDFIIGSDTEELVDYYYAPKALTPIKIDRERQETAEPINEVKTVPANRREDSYRNEGDLSYEYESIRITIPIISHANVSTLINLRPSTFGLSWRPEDITWKRNTVEFTVGIKGYGFDRDEAWVAQQINQQKLNVTNHIHIMDTEIIQGNENLKQQIRMIINQRKEKLINDKEKYNSLLRLVNIPLKKKEDDIVKKIQLDTSPLVKHTRPNPVQPEIYTIDREKVMGVIHIMDNQGRQFEKTPDTYKNSGENDLRNILLVNLNSFFEGRATGETFNGKGKTDIHLNIAKGDILICECKIWAGQELYKKND